MQAVKRPHGGKHYKKKTNKRKNKFSYQELKSLQALNLDEKIKYAETNIETALKHLKRPSVAFSAGKDSTVLLHLILKQKPDIDVIYGNTTIEFPECVKFAKRLRKEWNLNFHTALPEVSFLWVVKNYGWPLLGKTFGVGGVAHKDSRAAFFKRLKKNGKLKGQYKIQSEIPISSACCAFLKEKPSKKLQKKLGVDGVLLGILASESRQRMFNFLEYGSWYYAKSQKLWKAHPLAIWTDNDIWQYIKKYKIPYSALYDMGFNEPGTGKRITHKRNGCMFCGMDLKYPNNHLAIMRYTHPKAWRALMLKMGLGQVLLDLHVAIYQQYDLFSEIMPLDDYIDKFPCAFDRI
ncbi:phosphoadenosine phosphosulfate reductase family protein [Desulfococcaceae bacterium HSG7]|nr:phosphoadenosine phosphosulfate reductase family protein [Desulfococcaceae bacterium HSG7]